MQKLNIKRKDLSKQIYSKVGFSKVISENLVDDIVNLFFNNIVAHDKIKIKNFGVFLKRDKSQRVGRNPKTKETKLISKRNVVTFKASVFFKTKINEYNKNERS